MMRLMGMFVLLTAMLFSVGCAEDTLSYEITLPAAYNAGEARYPAVYLLPQDGYAADDSGIAQKLTALMDSGACAPMIIVRPVFEPGMDLHAQLQRLVAEIDGRYRTVADKEHRALMGTGTGGYLAYALGLTKMDKKLQPLKESNLFHYIVSIRGDFSGEGNPWLSAYGSVHDLATGMNLSAPGVFDRFYTYLDAPVDDAWTNMDGATNDIGALFIGFATGSAAHEFTVRPGAFDDAFLTESVFRAAQRLTERMDPERTAKQEMPVQPAEADETPVVDGDFQKIELMGQWRFRYTGAQMLPDAPMLTKAQTESWASVRPGVTQWTKGFGNIGDDNVYCAYGPDYFDYFITGNGYYFRSFELPEAFDSEDLLLSVGYVDDRCEVFLNGVRVGATGLDVQGQPTGETTWAVHSLFEIDPSLIVRGGENTLVVRAYNDLPYGAGGWYGGPIGLYSRAAYEQLYVSAQSERFYEETFASGFAAKAKMEEGAIDNEYLIYLPPDYETSNKRYPTVYLLHQFNSDHTSYRVDKVNELFDQGIEKGAFDGMIVVIPNSNENSWWAGDWEKMITQELIPHIDAKYRTIRDARYRLTAGCSMGGQGAMAVALRNPDCFTGAISFFGAFSYGAMSNPNVIAATESAAYLDSFSLYFICGNQDSYGFGVPAIELNQHLTRMGVNHRFFIENGGHDGGFYLPRFIDAFSYVRGDMYRSDEAVGALLSGSLEAEGTTVKAQLDACEGIEAYFYAAEPSAYTKETLPSLSVPLTLRAKRGEETVFSFTQADISLSAENLHAAFECELPQELVSGTETTLTLEAAVFDRVFELGRMAVGR